MTRCGRCVERPAIHCAVPVPRDVALFEEGGNFTVSCRRDDGEDISAKYWVTPGGRRVSLSTTDGKYVLEDSTMVVRNAVVSDMGRYWCVPVVFKEVATAGPTAKVAKEDVFLHRSVADGNVGGGCLPFDLFDYESGCR